MTSRGPDGKGRVLLALHTARGSFVHLPGVLNACGRPVDAVVRLNQPIDRSRWLRQVHRTGACEREWAAKLAECLESGVYDLLVVGDEFALRAIYAQPMPRTVWPLLPLAPDGEAAQTVGHKIEFYRWCLRHALPIPETRIPEHFADIAPIVEELGGRCLIKGDDGMGGYAIYPVKGDDVAQQLGKLDNKRRWLVQRREPGPMGCALFFAARGKLQAWYAMRSCLSTGVDGLGHMIASEAWLEARVGALCARVAMAAGLHGMGGFDFISDARGELRLIDSHLGRCVALSHFARADGVCFGQAIGRWLNGESPAVMPTTESGRSFVKFPEVVKHIHVHGVRGLGKVLRRKARMPLVPPGDGHILRRQIWSMAMGGVRALTKQMRARQP